MRSVSRPRTYGIYDAHGECVYALALGVAVSVDHA